MKIHTGTYFKVDVRGDSEALSAYPLETTPSNPKLRQSEAVHRTCDYKFRRTGFFTSFAINCCVTLNKSLKLSFLDQNVFKVPSNFKIASLWTSQVYHKRNYRLHVAKPQGRESERSIRWAVNEPDHLQKDSVWVIMGGKSQKGKFGPIF